MSYLKLLSLVTRTRKEQVSLKRDTCFVVRSDKEVVPLVQHYRNTFAGTVLFFHDIDTFHSQLKTCIITKKLPKGYDVIDGPNAAIFGQEPTLLIIDYTAIPSQKLSSLNELFDKPPRFLGRLLGPNVKIASVITQELAISGLPPDCYSRLTYTENISPQKGPRLSRVIEKVSHIPSDAFVVEFHHSKDWQTEWLGAPALGKEADLSLSMETG